MTTTSGKRRRDGFDLVLRLLDHQIVGSGGELLGEVDNLEMMEIDGDLMVTGIVVGPAGLGPRLPGKLGRSASLYPPERRWTLSRCRRQRVRTWSAISGL